MPDPAFILVRPQMGENIGAAARAMLNFGLTDLRIVAPRDGWPNPAAIAMASGASRVLDAARLHRGIADAVAECSFVFATTARPRDMVKDVFTPEEAICTARDRIAHGQKVAFLFGPERTGLENDEIAQANAIVTVPVNADFPSLNLAQCALLMGYEWRRQTDGTPPAGASAQADVASVIEIEKLAQHWEERLEEVSFFYPPTKAAHMKLMLRNLWSRLPLMRSDVQILHGALRQLVRNAKDPKA